MDNDHDTIVKVEESKDKEKEEKDDPEYINTNLPSPPDPSISLIIEKFLIMEYLVTISKRRAFWSLNEDILKITILKTNTPYPSRKIRVSVPAFTKDHKGINLNTSYPEDKYVVLEIWNEYNILEDIKRGPYSKKSLIGRIQSLDLPY
ncbi:hypothetical protein Tco_0359881 [Tanacetum coccineum]